MAISASERFKLKKLIKEMASYRGRHTELVTVYIPAGYDINKITTHLSQEQGTASNIKSSSTRKNVQDALERMIQHLKIYPKTPPNGLAAFSGNVAEREGQSDVQVWSIEPPDPLKIRIYRCDKEFVLDPLIEMVEEKNVYGLVVVDRRDATIALLRGKAILPLVKTHSEVPGKTRAGGQCLVNDSLVQLHDGSLPKIEEVNNPNKVKSMVMNSIKDSNITDKWNVKKDCIYKIITKCPRIEVRSSKDHVFFVATEDRIIEKKAEELSKDDLLIMPERIDVKGKVQKIDLKHFYNSFTISKEGRELLIKKRKSNRLFQKKLAKELGLTQTAISVIELGKRNPRRTTLKKICEGLGLDFHDFLDKYTKPIKYREVKLPNRVDNDFAQFLGYYIGDGNIERDRITLSEQLKQVALEYKAKYDEYLSIDSSYRFRKSKNYHQIRITSRPLVRLIKESFPEIKKSKDTTIPSLILNSKDEVVASFLKGLFDAEGYISGTRVGLGMNNKMLIQQLQMVLLRFGILASLSEYDNRKNEYSDNPRYTIEIGEKTSLEKFKEYIGFTSNYKSEKLNNAIKNKSNTSYVRQMILPGKEVRKTIEKAGYNLKQFPKVSNFFNNKRMMSKQVFNNSILNNIKDKKLYKKLKEIHDIPILPVQIKSIEIRKKSTPMVDLSVKDRNFIANGLFVHNSAPRFERLREGATKDHFKKVAAYMKEQFLMNKDLKGIIVGGPGPTKHTFVEGGYITDQVRQKIIAIKDLSYTGEFGLQELLDKSQDVLANEEVAAEKQIMEKFFKLISIKPNMVAYGEAEVMKALGMGAVETLLLSEDLDDDKIEEFEKKAHEFNTEVKIISVDTREGVQLRDIGKIGAILRYELQG